MSEKEKINMDNDLIKLKNYGGKKYLNKMLEHFDVEILRTNPLIKEDILVYNYCLYDTKNGLYNSKTITRYERDYFIFDDQVFYKKIIS